MREPVPNVSRWLWARSALSANNNRVTRMIVVKRFATAKVKLNVISFAFFLSMLAEMQSKDCVSSVLGSYCSLQSYVFLFDFNDYYI